MNIAPLTPGQMVNVHGKIGHIRLFEDDIALIKFKDNTTQVCKPEELSTALENGDIHLVRAINQSLVFADISEEQSLAINRLEQYCTRLDQEPYPCAKGIREKVISEVSAILEDKNPPSISHLHRVYFRWISNDKNMAAVLLNKKSKRCSSIVGEVLDLMNNIITKEYLKLSRPTILSVYNKFKSAYQKTGYIGHMPSLSTFRRRVMELDRIEVIKYRYGESAARAEGRSATSKIEVSRILERAEMDAAHFNIGLLSNDKHFIGKPSIFFIIDCHSRAILGYAIHVGKQTETPGAVIHALRYAISIKNDPLYPVHGLPSLIVMDQGPGYASNQTVEFLNKLKVEIQVTATKMGWGKPFMERFIGTSRTKFFQGLDGYLGKLDKSRYSDETIKKSAKHTIEEFRIKFSEFIIDYHNSPHSGLNGKTPLQVWRESAKQYHPIIPDDMGADTLLRGLREQKTLTHVTGINCQYQVFNSKELQNLYHRLLKNQVPGKHNQKIKVTILRDPLDAGGISVVDPSTKA